MRWLMVPGVLLHVGCHSGEPLQLRDAGRITTSNGLDIGQPDALMPGAGGAGPSSSEGSDSPRVFEDGSALMETNGGSGSKAATGNTADSDQGRDASALDPG